jgi:hypothetical protein
MRTTLYQESKDKQVTFNATRVAFWIYKDWQQITNVGHAVCARREHLATLTATAVAVNGDMHAAAKGEVAVISSRFRERCICIMRQHSRQNIREDSVLYFMNIPQESIAHSLILCISWIRDWIRTQSVH